LIHLIIGLPITYAVVGVEAMEMQMRRFNSDLPLTGIVILIIGGIVWFFIFIVLATIGGLIGVPIFEKRKGTADTPPPPQDFGAGPGTGPGTYGAGM
jgi:hypothetical protein